MILELNAKSYLLFPVFASCLDLVKWGYLSQWFRCEFIYLCIPSQPIWRCQGQLARYIKGTFERIGHKKYKRSWRSVHFQVSNSNRLDWMPGITKGRWNDEQPQDRQLCHLRLWELDLIFEAPEPFAREEDFLATDEEDGASIGLLRRTVLPGATKTWQIVKIGIRDGYDEPPGGVLVCPHLGQLYPFNLSPQEETLMIRTEERGAPPGPSLLDQGGANSNHQKLQLTSAPDSSCRVQHRHPE